MFIACAAVIAAGGAAFGQQSQREHIYMGGKAIAAESSVFSAPAISITSPTSGSAYNTYWDHITLSGVAGGAAVINGVTWVSNRGGSGDCTYTATSWVCDTISLLAGQNVITITARNVQSSYATDLLTIHYCKPTLSADSVNMAAGAGSGTVTNTCVGACNWTAVSNTTSPAWIAVTSGANSSGTGSVGYSVAANTGPERSGTITIAGKTLTIIQASGCAYTLNPASAWQPVSGGTGSVTVTTATNCPRTVSNSLSWITITGGTGGKGNGSVAYSVDPNISTLRSGVMYIGNAAFSLTQEGAPFCGDGICQEGSPAACPYDCSSTCTPECMNGCYAEHNSIPFCLGYCQCPQ